MMNPTVVPLGEKLVGPPSGTVWAVAPSTIRFTLGGANSLSTIISVVTVRFQVVVSLLQAIWKELGLSPAE
jgi:hypothetical protein